MSIARLKLLKRIERHYKTRTVSISAGTLALPFVRIAEPDRVLDDVVELEDRRLRSPGLGKNDPPRMPYWAELWDSALGIAQVLGRTFSGEGTVLDLGCGMGLAGMVAAALGGRVLLADLETPALLLARLNTMPWAERVRVRRVNWQKDRLGEKFDLLLGADILYEAGQWDYLDPFWREHLASGGTLLLGEPRRASADRFEAWAEKRGWTVEQTDEPVATLPRGLRIFRLKRYKEIKDA